MSCFTRYRDGSFPSSPTAEDKWALDDGVRGYLGMDAAMREND